MRFETTGSKGDIYVVEMERSGWTCSCPAGVRGKKCRHKREAFRAHLDEIRAELARVEEKIRGYEEKLPEMKATARRLYEEFQVGFNRGEIDRELEKRMFQARDEVTFLERRISREGLDASLLRRAIERAEEPDEEAPVRKPRQPRKASRRMTVDAEYADLADECSGDYDE